MAASHDMVVSGVRPGKVLLVGESMGLFSAGEEGPCSEVGSFRASVAGAELNVAVGLERLGQHPVYMTRLGSDPIGDRIRCFMRQNGLDTSLVGTDASRSTGFMMKSKVERGDPKTYYFRKGSAASAISPSDIGSIDCAGISLMHMTGILPALSASTMEASEALMDMSRGNRIFISFDPNERPALWKSDGHMRRTLLSLCAKADLVLPGISEGRHLFGLDKVRDIGQAFIDNGARYAVVKDGPDGAYATDGHEGVYVPGFKVDAVVDTVGAGDGFAAGVLSALLEGRPLSEALERGCAIGAMQTQVVSDNEGLPTRAELDDFMARHERADVADGTIEPVLVAPD